MKATWNAGLSGSAAGFKVARAVPWGIWMHRAIKGSAVVVLLATVAFVGCSRAPGKPEADQTPLPLAVPAMLPDAAPAAQVVAYYFHATVRCETCLTIEKQAESVMARRFGAELARRELAFRTVDYNQPENAHFLKDYKLSSPSLVLVRQKAGTDQQWKVLERTWDLVKFPPVLDQYIEEETRKLLEGTATGAPQN
jgi:hypothetical protein